MPTIVSFVDGTSEHVNDDSSTEAIKDEVSKMRGCRKDDMVLLQDNTMLADLWEWEANGRSTQEGTSLFQPVSTNRREAVALYFPTRFEATTMVCKGFARQASGMPVIPTRSQPSFSMRLISSMVSSRGP